MTKLKNLNFEKLQNHAEYFKVEQNDKNSSYLKTYPEFLKYFDSPNEITEHDLVISSHFVYGWMPTIINLRLEYKDRVLSLLNQVKKGHLLIESELETLKAAINNSMVGLSKLLHFIKPDNYAIWDSRIYRYLTDHKTASGIGNVNLYLEYIEGLKKIAISDGFNEFHNKVSNAVGYKVSKFRAIELVMFEADKKNQLNCS